MSDNVSNNTSSELEQLDIVSFLNDFLHRFQRMWWLVLLLTVGFATLFYFHTRSSYRPSYVAEATVSVELINGGTSANKGTAEQMGLIFPYIMSSGTLQDVIAADLGTKSVPGTIKISNISGTNLLNITVRSSNPDNAYDVLLSVMKNYPSVAQFVVGQTTLTVVDDSGVPSDSGRESVIRGSIRKGALIGLALGILFLVFQVATFRTVRNENELRALLNIPCLGTLPFCQRKLRRNATRTEINILYDSHRSDYIEAMRLIRTRLERQMEGKQVLMVTSSIAGEGKSTVAANLALSMALRGKKVILVDCDLRNPSVGEIFDLKEQSFPGLVSILRGKCNIDEATWEVKDKEGKPVGLTLIPGGERNSRLVEILGSDAMRDVIDQLRERADVVVLDTPPSAVLVDAMMLVKHVDAVAYVVMSDYARRRYIFEGVDELTSSGAPIVGCILNGAQSKSGGYGYYGSYGYRSRYGYGYGEAKNTSASETKDAKETKE